MGITTPPRAVAKTKVQKAAVKKKAVFKNIFAGAVLKTCLSCNQVAGEPDRNAPKGVELGTKWIHTFMSSKNILTPYGTTCYPCFHLHRKFFNKISQEALNEERAKFKDCRETIPLRNPTRGTPVYSTAV